MKTYPGEPQTIKVALDPRTFERLMAAAADERRPIAWQAEVILQRALARRRASASDQRESAKAVPA